MSEIKELGILLNKSLDDNEIIKDTHYTLLTAPGDNYGSVMLKLDVTIRNKDTEDERVLNLVAKTLPETEMFREIFKIQTTYTNEMAFYDIIVPTLKKFQEEIGVNVINSFAKCYGTRKNMLKNSNTIDDDAVLLLENLKVQGYSNADRKAGFDFETTKLVLRDLAQFHASFQALKLQKPEIFNKNVRPYCENFEPNDPKLNVFYEDIFKEVAKGNDECLKLAPKVKFWVETLRSQPREPYATVIHTDLWINNTMQSFETGKPVTNKFVDFQVYTYGSSAADVFFLLWTSVQLTVLKENIDFFLQFYHEEFINTLENHKCDITSFSYNKFMEELKLEAEYEFPHSITFMFILSLANGADAMYMDIKEVLKGAPPQFNERTWFMVSECHKRGWLN